MQGWLPYLWNIEHGSCCSSRQAVQQDQVILPIVEQSGLVVSRAADGMEPLHRDGQGDEDGGGQGGVVHAVQ